jgi:CBS domain-containing protein
VRQIQASAQGAFPVIQAGQATGILTRDALRRGIAERGGGVYVSEVMDRAVPHVAPGDSLLNITEQFRNLAGAPVLVVADDRLIGMLTAAGVEHFVALQQTLRPEV